MSALTQEIQDAVRSVFDERRIPTHREKRLLNYEDAAAYLECSKRTIEERVARRDLPAVRDGRLCRIDIQDLDRWIAEHKDGAKEKQ
jgi:excisionase family DNA binding protein